MLETLRVAAKTWVAKGLLLLLVASFAIWGFVAVLYFILIFSLSKFSAYIERRLQVDKR